MAEKYAPEVAGLALDIATGRVGVVMAIGDSRAYLRPVGGGREWDALPNNLRAPGPDEAHNVRSPVMGEADDGRGTS